MDLLIWSRKNITCPLLERSFLLKALIYMHLNHLWDCVIIADTSIGFRLTCFLDLWGKLSDKILGNSYNIYIFQCSFEKKSRKYRTFGTGHQTDTKFCIFCYGHIKPGRARTLGKEHLDISQFLSTNSLDSAAKSLFLLFLSVLSHNLNYYKRST